MRLIQPRFEIYEQGPGLEGIYEAVERAGRTCYKSTRPEGQTAKDFVDRMIASQHYAMLEHGTVYLKTPAQYNYDDLIRFYSRNPYSKVFEHKEDYKSKEWEKAGFYITTNLRVLIENDRLGDLELLCEPTEFHEKRVTVRFTTDRGVSHEFVRHRVFSFAQESTRYCNYSKDKFGGEITFIIPSWLKATEGDYGTLGDPLDIQFEEYGNNVFEREFINELINTEFRYMNILDAGYTPQQARQVLPNALKTELVMTGFVSDWQHFFDLRARGTTGAPHPDAKALAEPLMGEFYKRNLIQ